MRFYDLRLKIKDNAFGVAGVRSDEEREAKENLCKTTMEFMGQTVEKEGCVFLSRLTRQSLTICVLNDKVDELDFADRYMRELGYEYEILSRKEISMTTFFDEVSSADRNGLILDEYDVIGALNMGDLFHSYNTRSVPFNDRVADDGKTLDEIVDEARGNFFGERYEAELSRIIGSKQTEKFVGVPAHYVLQSTDGEHRRIMIRNLVSALYDKGRLLSRRYTIVGVESSQKLLRDVYAVNDGAAVLIKVDKSDLEDGKDGFRRKSCDIDAICEIVKENCSRVLTVFSLDCRSDSVKESILNALSGLAVVDISEDTYSKGEAVEVVRSFAKRDGVELGQGIVDKIMASDRSYDVAALTVTYNKWRHEYLSTCEYPEYKSYFACESQSQSKAKKRDAYEELQAMIGLSPVKKLVDEAINYFKLRREYRRRGLNFNRPAMHMVFTGSPGTAKTSVARLLARILKDEGILSSGDLIEVGRADLIGQYVGQTAPKVKAAFKKAMGSILFIDEAYSLVDDKKGLYGDEAINTIVQEMENCRDDLIVIFAGYKDEMKTFLEWNPGLNSRIAFHVPFDDYSTQELVDITRLIASKSGFSIEAGAEDKLKGIFDRARLNPTFGNGRFARNLFEKAKLSLANRHASADLEYVSDEQLTTLTADDFNVDLADSPRQKIGF